MFPHINRINDVLPHIVDKDEIKVKEKGWYTAIDYQVQNETTFDNDAARECRGIKFYEDGEIAARSFHKFFNRGEHPELEPDLDPNHPEANNFEIQEKVDGSLVHTIVNYTDDPLTGDLHLMTKAGFTDVSNQAEELLFECDYDVLDFLADFDKDGYTHMFEFVSPNNRIVLFYEEPKLYYLTSRDKRTGEYVFFDYLANYFDTPKLYNENDLTNVKDWVDHEGAVLVWPNGERLKVKSDDYTLKHKTKDNLTQEKNVLYAVVEDEVDDLANILPEEDYARVAAYRKDVLENIDEAARKVKKLAEKMKEDHGDDRASIAKEALPQLSKALVPVFWRTLNGNDPQDVILKMISDKCNKQKHVDEKRDVIGVKWEDYQMQFNEE